MPKLPTVNGKQAKAALMRCGFYEARISGGHHIMKKDGNRFLVTVPIHGKTALPIGTLRAIIRDAGLTVEQFTEALKP